MAAISQSVRQSLIKEVGEQLERLSETLAARDALFLAALEDLRGLTAEARKTAAVVTTKEAAVKKSFDRQEYRDLVGRLRALVATATPMNATVAIVSKGDPQLIQLQGRRGWHFPQLDDGVFAGYYPKDSAAAIEAVERLRARGADYLLFPATALWWLEHYAEFASYITGRYPIVAQDNQTGVLFALRSESGPMPSTPSAQDQEYAWMVTQLREIVSSVLPADANLLVVSKGDPDLLDMGGRPAAHFPQSLDGVYAGHHPASSADAISYLEQLRQKGGQFLVIPKTADWWLDHYRDFARYLRTNYRLLVHQRYVCKIFAL